MDDNNNFDEDERRVELSTIAAIFPELLVDEHDPYTATLDLAVTPVQPLRILFRPASDAAPLILPTPPTSLNAGQNGLGNRPTAQPAPLDEHDLSHLPPLTLRITLPQDYPSTSPPVVSISVNPEWLSPVVLEQLKADCARLWEELGRDQVVYAYIDHVQQAAENAFGLAGASNASLSSDLKLSLLDFDLKTKREIFERETFDCGVCLEPKKGAQCHRLLQCGHVFCTVCLQDYYNNCIKEGDVNNITCLDPSCGKDEPAAAGPAKKRKRDPTLNPSELLQIPIEQEQVQRYVWLKRKRRIENDKNTVYCPRQWCQGAAKSSKRPKRTDTPIEDDDSDDEEEPSRTLEELLKLPTAERLAICEDCNYAFCAVCLKSWHGELVRCRPPRSTEELNEEEKASAQYIKMYSTPCPTCDAPAQKSMGCNHMTCFRCQTHFCYLCCAYLMPSNPYSHYNSEGTPCYMRLWELEGGHGPDIPDERGARLRPEVVAEWEAAADLEGDEEPELPPEHFDAFRGDAVRPFDDEDTDNEEPAPDQRRNRNVIEIVNFARPGGQNARRIELPDLPPANVGAAAPPPAPNAQRQRRPRGQGQPGNRQRAMAREPARNNRDQGQGRARAGQRPARMPQDIRVAEGLGGLGQPNRHVVVDDEHDEDDAGPPGELPPAAPGQGNQQAGPIGGMGLDRFLQLALHDQEDEWDSDEIDDDDADFRNMEREPPAVRIDRDRPWR